MVWCLAQGSHLSRGQFLPVPRFEPTTLDYNALSTRPRLPQSVNMRDRRTSQARLETQEKKAHGNLMATPREIDTLTLEQSAQGIDERIHKDSKLTQLKLNPHKNKRPHHISTDGNDDERVLPRVLPTKEGGSEVGK